MHGQERKQSSKGFWSGRRPGTALVLVVSFLLIPGALVKDRVQSFERESVPAIDSTSPSAKVQTVTPVSSPGQQAGRPIEYAENRILVRFARQATEARIAEIVSQAGAETVRSFQQRNVVAIALPPTMTSEDGKALFESFSGVESVEFDLAYRITTLPNDPAFGVQWGMNNSGQNSGDEDVDINAPEAWIETTGSRDFVIGIIDTGIATSHPDLVANLWSNPAEIPGNGIDDDGNGYVDDIYGIDAYAPGSVPEDDNGHGTHVAGVIGAVGNNGIDIAGVMWDAELMACRAFDELGVGLLSAVLECFDYYEAAIDSGTEIPFINASWGGTGYSELLFEGISRLNERGVVLVAAAGNDGRNVDIEPNYPSGYDLPNIVSVGAIDARGRYASFSNFGTAEVDIAAPGVSIYSLSLLGPGVGQSGTSASAPFVTGSLALVQASAPSMTSFEVKDYILATGVIDSALADKVGTSSRLRIRLPFIDLDGDEISDRWERRFGLDPGNALDATQDFDADGLTNLEEYLNATNPNLSDSDNDGLNDGSEVDVYGTDPNDPDSDADGLSDGDEVSVHTSDPRQQDSDGDGLDDGEEVNVWGTSPVLVDTDGDDLADPWEIRYDLDPLDPVERNEDRDGDGLTTFEEQAAGTDPRRFDTDNDGLSDGDEVSIHGTDPLNADTDSDDMADSWEVANSFDPLDPIDGGLDADGDGYSNREEFQARTDPNDSASKPPARPWTGSQGSPNRLGFIPIETDVVDFRERWVRISAAQNSEYDPGFERQAIFVPGRELNDQFLSRLDAATGAEEWRVAVPEFTAFSQSIVDDTTLYIAVRSDSLGISDQVVAVNKWTGNELYVIDLGRNGLTKYMAVDGGSLFILDATELARFDKNTGAETWRAPIPRIQHSPAFAPAIVGDEVITYADSSILVYSRSDGGLLRTLELGPCYSYIRGIAIEETGDALVGCADLLLKVDLANGNVLWQTVGTDNSVELAADRNRVFVPATNGLKALDIKTGTEIWRWDTDARLESNIVATLGNVFVQSNRSTIALDSESGARVWESRTAGQLSLSSDGSLLIQDSVHLTLVDLVGDRDGDGMSDWWEQYFGLRFSDPTDAGDDADADGLTNVEEYSAGTSPLIRDTDGDELDDAFEVNASRTDPTDEDSDGDGLLDGEEVSLYGTDPNRLDSDYDHFTDSDEIQQYQTNPSDPQSYPVFPITWSESFENGLPAGWVSGDGALHGFTVTSGDATDGTSALISEPLDVVGWASVEFQINVAHGEILFDARLLDGDRFDALHVYVDGQLSHSYNGGSWERQRFSVPAGVRTIRFELDGRFGNGARALIDNLLFVPALGFGANSENVLVVEANRLSEYSADGDLVRGPISIPNAEMALNLVVDNKHQILIADPPRIHRYDPYTQTFRVLMLPGYRSGPYASMTVYGDRLLVSNQAGGVYEVDSDGDLVDASFPGDTFSQIQIDPDGRFYGLSASGRTLRVFEPESGEVLSEFGPIDSPTAFSVGEGGSVQMLTDGPSITLFDQNLSPLQSVLLDSADGSVDQSVDMVRSESGTFFVGARGELVIADETVSKQLVKPIVQVGAAQGTTYVASVPRAGEDTDGDLMPDWWEYQNGLNLTDGNDGSIDSDGDGLSSAAEFLANSRPSISDTDGDGLMDGLEVNNYGTSPVLDDSDADGLTDHDEIFAYSTNPLAADSDGDGVYDGVEVSRYQTDPTQADTDGDGIDDRDEWVFRTGPRANADASVDVDSDGLTALQEFRAGTDPYNPDSDGDHLSDGVEVNGGLTDPLNADTDGDYMIDGWEIAMSLDPRSAGDANADQDADGFSNRVEYFGESSAADVDSVPTPVDWFTDQGTNRHRGYVPTLTDPGVFSTNWTSDPDPVSVAPLKQVSQSGSQVFVVSERDLDAEVIFVSAIDTSTGAPLWNNSFPFPQYWQFSPAANDGETVYAQSGNGPNSFIFGFDATSGQIRFQQSIDTQGPSVRAPAIKGGLLYTNTGYIGGVGGFNTSDGSPRWYTALSRYDGFSPAVDGDEVIVYNGDRGLLYVFNAATGAQRFSIRVEVQSPGAWSARSSPVIGTQNNVIIANVDRLMSVDLSDRSVTWTRQASQEIPSAPALANGAVYFIDPGYVVALDERTGNELWRWELQQDVYSDVVATADHVFVSTALETYGIDTASGLSDWNYPAGGHLTIGRDLSLYIAGADGTLTSIATRVDSDSDGMPNDWEDKYGLDSDDSSDAASDLDGDGLTQLEEYQARTHPREVDTDGDGLSDFEEVNQSRTQPTVADTDRDGLNDREETEIHGTDPLSADTDGDGVPDNQEIGSLRTNATTSDTDGDGFTDWLEQQRGSDPGNANSVPRRATELVESFEAGAVPKIFENSINGQTGWVIDEFRAFDGRYVIRPEWHDQGGTATLIWEDNFADGLLSFYAKMLPQWCCDELALLIDGQVELTVTEAQNWTKHSVAIPEGLHTVSWQFRRLQASNGVTELPTFIDLIEFVSLDADGDGMRTDWEERYGLDPNDSSDAGNDPDLDGLTNLEEYHAQTSPISSDTDGDEMPDRWELENGLDPLTDDAIQDPDSDGFRNVQEHRAGTSPNVADTDGDEMPDGWEASNSLNPLANDAQADPDQDGSTNLEEYSAGTDPQNASSQPTPPPAPPAPTPTTPPPQSSGGGGGSSGPLQIVLLVLLAAGQVGRRRRRMGSSCGIRFAPAEQSTGLGSEPSRIGWQ